MTAILRTGFAETSAKPETALRTVPREPRTAAFHRKRLRYAAAFEVRLRARAQDSAATVAARMAKSAEEMSHWSEYDYVVVNRDLDASVAEVEAILTAERLRRTRQIGLADFVNRLRGG